MRIPAAALVLFALTAPRAALAQVAQGFALPTFDPSERGSDWFASESLDLRGSLRPAAGVVLDWARDPLVVNAAGVPPLVADQVVLHPGGSLVLADRLRFALDLPVAIDADGTPFGSRRASFDSPATSALGDLRLGGDVRLYGKYGEPVTLAAGAQFYLPTGSQGSYMSDGTARLQPRLMVAGEVPWFEYAARAGFELRPDQSTFSQSALGSTFVFSAAAGLRVPRSGLVFGPELWGATVVTAGQAAFEGKNTPVDALFGAHYSALGVRLGLGGGGGLTTGLGSPSSRLVASVEWAPEAATDRDGDGVNDDEDACPTTPGVRTRDPRTNGCPPDRDGDGVPDADDACPDVPGERTADPRTNGCPPDRDRDGVVDTEDACPDVPGVRTSDPKTNGCPPDRDHDGVPDAEDACPDVPGVRTSDPKTSGCPADRDGDGVPDAEDACPDVAGVRTSDPKTNGCPVDPDRDKDGIPNAEDACPDVPGKPDPDPKRNGCPLAFVEGGLIRITEQVKFRTDSARLEPAATPVLTAVAAVLQAHPEIAHVRIEGHTDSAGGKRHNQTLSEGRAASVRQWLIAHRVPAARLTSVGFGLARPLVSNDDEEGRRQNRRVEFHIEEGPATRP